MAPRGGLDCSRIEIFAGRSPLGGLGSFLHRNLFQVGRPEGAWIVCASKSSTDRSPRGGLDCSRIEIFAGRSPRGGLDRSRIEIFAGRSPLGGWDCLRIEIFYRSVAPRGLGSFAHRNFCRSVAPRGLGSFAHRNLLQIGRPEGAGIVHASKFYAGRLPRGGLLLCCEWVAR